MRKAKYKERFHKMWMWILVVVAVLVTAVFFVFPPGSKGIKQYVDEDGSKYPNSIAEKRYVEVNGVKLGMFIKGKDISNPVLLYLNGGPGIPDYFLTQQYDTGLEDVFTVCYLDYRGTALSYSSDLAMETCNTEQFLSDVDKAADYLRKEFGQEKLYLLGHSFGTYIGLLTAQAHPEKYHAYIAMSQIANQPESELLAYHIMKERYADMINEKMVQKLDAYETDTADQAWLNRWFASGVRDDAMHELGGGTLAGMRSVITGIFFPSLCCTAYSWQERMNIWRGKAFLSGSDVATAARNFRAIEAVPSLEIPIYFFAGKQDLTCYYPLQKEYYEQLQAPVKKFYTFENSAHSPLFEEPEKAVNIILTDILGSTNN